MDVLLLRLIHIGAGAFWVGSVFTFFLFVQPATAAVGPYGAKVSNQLLNAKRLPVWILSAGITTVLAGIWLIWITTNGLNPDLLFGISRLGYTIGGVVAIVTLGVGGLYVFPRTMLVAQTIGRMIGEARPPTPDEQQLLARAARETRSAGWIVLAGLAIAIACMATAQYWSVVG
jgi:hypothetical protein